MTWIEDLDNQFIVNEQKRSKMYKDSKGIPTIGIGFNLKRRDARDVLKSVGADYDRIVQGIESLSEGQISAVFKLNVLEAIADAKALYLNFDFLDDIRKRALVDLAFNMGRDTLKKFVQFNRAVNMKNFERAALQLKRSLWFDQTGTRAIRITAMILDGVDHYKETAV